MPALIQSLETLIGPYVPIEGRNGMDAINLEYVLAGVLLVTFFIGLFVLISNFQKTFSRRAK